jgi:hypothetical protein
MVISIGRVLILYFSRKVIVPWPSSMRSNEAVGLAADEKPVQTVINTSISTT